MFYLYVDRNFISEFKSFSEVWNFLDVELFADRYKDWSISAMFDDLVKHSYHKIEFMGALIEVYYGRYA